MFAVCVCMLVDRTMENEPHCFTFLSALRYVVGFVLVVVVCLSCFRAYNGLDLLVLDWYAGHNNRTHKNEQTAHTHTHTFARAIKDLDKCYSLHLIKHSQRQNRDHNRRTHRHQCTHVCAVRWPSYLADWFSVSSYFAIFRLEFPRFASSVYILCRPVALSRMFCHSFCRFAALKPFFCFARLRIRRIAWLLGSHKRENELMIIPFSCVPRYHSRYFRLTHCSFYSFI